MYDWPHNTTHIGGGNSLLSLKRRLSVPDFVSQLWKKSCETKSGTECLGSRLQFTSENVVLFVSVNVPKPESPSGSGLCFFSVKQKTMSDKMEGKLQGIFQMIEPNCTVIPILACDGSSFCREAKVCNAVTPMYVNFHQYLFNINSFHASFQNLQ